MTPTPPISRSTKRYFLFFMPSLRYSEKLQDAVDHNDEAYQCEEMSYCPYTGTTIITKIKMTQNWDSLGETLNEEEKQILAEIIGSPSLEGELLKKALTGPDLVSSIARKLAFTTITGIRLLLLKEFPSEKHGTFDTSEKVLNFIQEVLRFGASHVNRDRVFITGHQGSGKTSLTRSIR